MRSQAWHGEYVKVRGHLFSSSLLSVYQADGYQDFHVVILGDKNLCLMTHHAGSILKVFLPDDGGAHL